jgi:predicted transcriptional regulator
MKVAKFPDVNVEQSLLQVAESVLREGETLSTFVSESIRASVQRRKFQSEFVARGLIAREEARATGKYFTAEEVHRELDLMLVHAERGMRRESKLD